MNTKSWTSFHSYIPNWYIAENNFFYSGLNGCCDDLEAIAVNTLPATTTSTTTFCWTCRPIPTTTSTTTSSLECELRGDVFKTSCDLSGSAIITVPPATTTTICQRPANLTGIGFISGYTITGDPATISSGSFDDACDAMSFLSTITNYDDIEITTLTGSTVGLYIENVVYYDVESTDCTLMPDGWYFTEESMYSTGYVYHVEGGIITEIQICYCGTTTTTTTIINIPECCGVVVSNGPSNYYFDVNNNQLTTLPGLSGSVVGMTSTTIFTFSSPGNYTQYNITLSPFTASVIGTYAWPSGTFTATCAYDNNALLVVDSSATPEDVYIYYPSTSSLTLQFSLQANRTAVGNMLYTTSGRLIIANQDGISGDYYITQYSDLSGTIELDINIGSLAPALMFECDCNIYIGDDSGNLYQISELYPYSALLISTGFIGTYAAQPISCVLDAFKTTTTTTTVLTCLDINGTFDSDISGWTVTDPTLGDQWAWSSNNGGSAVFIGADVEGCISQDILTIGNTYRITFDLEIVVDGLCSPGSRSVKVYAGTTASSAYTTPGVQSVDITLTCAGNTTFCITGYDTCSYGVYPGHVNFIFIDNVCVTEVL
jgi:hypothetical protein